MGEREHMNALDLLDARIGTALAELDLVASHRERGVSMILSAHSVVLVSTFEADGSPWVRISAVVLQGFNPSLAMLDRVLRLNREVRQGGFQLFEDRSLVFTTTLCGVEAMNESFPDTLRYVAAVADAVAPRLQALFGGTPGIAAVGGAPPC